MLTGRRRTTACELPVRSLLLQADDVNSVLSLFYFQTGPSVDTGAASCSCSLFKLKALCMGVGITDSS